MLSSGTGGAARIAGQEGIRIAGQVGTRTAGQEGTRLAGLSTFFTSFVSLRTSKAAGTSLALQRNQTEGATVGAVPWPPCLANTHLVEAGGHGGPPLQIGLQHPRSSEV